MALNPFMGWSITTLLAWFLSGKNSSSDTSSSDPEELDVNDTQIGTPVAVVMGRTLLRSPLVIYYGDFRADAYTETYAAHANFSAWPLILSVLMEWLTMPVTGNSDPATDPAKSQHTHGVTTTGGGGTTTSATPHGHMTKERAGPNYLMLLAQWLLSWLINGRNLKTTMQKGFKYHLGYQMLACVSGTDIRLRGVYLCQGGDWHKIWEGNVSREDYQAGPFVVSVNDDELFGGPDEGGGFIGEMHFYLGGPNQPADSWMQQQMTADTIPEELWGLTPAYRPFVSLVVPGAYVGKQATIPETWLDMQWIPSRLGLGAIGEDGNPAELIYEMVVNTEWGLKRSPDDVDVDSLIAAGQKLRSEGIGLTVVIDSRADVKSLIDSICDHLDMVRYNDPQTGKLSFKLIRDDYDANSLPILDDTICTSVTFTRTVWSNTVGEVSVSYTDSNYLYQPSTLSDNNPANIEINGGDRNPQTCDFKYFTTAANALWGAKRELRQQGFPLAAATLVCNRKAAAVRQGDIIKLNWLPYGIKDLIMRVTDMDMGTFVEGEIRIECIEDVFGLGKATFGYSGSTDWTRPVTYPTGVQLFHYFEAPWEIMHVNDTYVFALATAPDTKTQKWTVWRRRDSTWETTSSMIRWAPAGQLVGTYGEDGAAEDLVGFELIDLGGVADLAGRSAASGQQGFAAARNGVRLLMAGGEIMGWGDLVQLPNGHWRVQSIIRGTFDTVPAGHGAGDTVYFLDSGYYANVTTGGAVCPAGTIAKESYNITTATADGTEAFDTAKVTALGTVRRAERPNPPGRIRLTSHMHDNVPRLVQAAGNVSISWVLRNKRFSFGCVSQDDTGDYFTGLAITPEDGLQTVVEIYAGAEQIRREVLDNTATGFTYSWGQHCQDKLAFDLETRVEISAQLGNLVSHQRQTRSFAWRPPYIVAGCETEADVLAIIAAGYQDGNIMVSFVDESENRRVSVADMPLILVGTLADDEQPGAVLCQDGKWIIPSGTALAVTGQNIYETVTMSEGFVALSYFSPGAPGDLCAYQFDGSGFTRIPVPAM